MGIATDTNNKKLEVLNKTINHVDLLNIYRILLLYPTINKRKYVLFSSKHGAVYRIHHKVGKKNKNKSQ